MVSLCLLLSIPAVMVNLLVERVGNKDTIFHGPSIIYFVVSVSGEPKNTRVGRLWPQTAQFSHPWNGRVNLDFLHLLMLAL